MNTKHIPFNEFNYHTLSNYIFFIYSLLHNICIEGVLPKQVSAHADDGVASRVQADVALQHTLVMFVLLSASVAARCRGTRPRFARLCHRSCPKKTLHN